MMKSITLFTLPLFTILLALSSCSLEKCKFDKADNKYLLGQYDSLSFLENGTDTLKLKVTTEVITSYVKQGWVTANEFETGASSIYIKPKGIDLSVLVNSCSDLITVTLLHGTWLRNFHLTRDSISNIEMTVNNFQYQNCFVFNDTTKIKVKECIYTKEFGVVKLELEDGYLLEMINESE